jgi:hypothetical protein
VTPFDVIKDVGSCLSAAAVVLSVHPFTCTHSKEAFGGGVVGAAAHQKWFDSLKFSYDTSVPNAAHLEPQQGGCCTIMPYFIGDILELPVTTTQDYALSNYLSQYSIDVWKRQIELIMEQHGLINFIVHPHYITKSREWNVYKSLLAHLVQLRD